MLNKNQFDGLTKAEIFDEANTFTVSPKAPLAEDPDHLVPLSQVQELTTDQRVTASIATTYAIDWSKEVFDLTMTADTTFSDSNLPTGTDSKEIEVILQGGFTPTPPASWTGF